MMPIRDSGSSGGYNSSSWENLSGSSQSSSSSTSDEGAPTLGSDSYSTSAFEASVSEASSLAQVTGGGSVSSLSTAGGASSDNDRRRTIQGKNEEAGIGAPPPQLEDLAETDTGVTRTAPHRGARNNQGGATAVPTSPTELPQQHQEKGTEPSVRSGDVNLGPTAAEVGGQALDPSSILAPTTQRMSKSALTSSAEGTQGLSSRIAEARSSQATLFDRAWLEGIRSRRRRPSGDGAGTLGLRGNKQRQRHETRKGILESTGVSTDSPERPTAEFVEGGQQVDTMPAAWASAGGPRGGEEADGDSGGDQEEEKKERADIVRAYPPWNEERQSSLLTEACEAMVESVLQQTTACMGGGEVSRSFERPWLPSQWEAFQMQGCPPPPLDCSKVSIPRSLIGRVSADAAMERLRFPPPPPPPPPPPTARQRDRWKATLGSKEAGRSARRDAARRSKKAVSAYLSIKAAEIRTRRDHEAWLSRVASGLDAPIQDPLSLLGGCVESSRRLEEAFDRTRRRGGVLPSAAGCSRDTQDSRRPGATTTSSETVEDCADGSRKSTGRLGRGNENGALDDGAAAARRYCLSTPHLEHLVVSSRCLLAEEEERSKRESSEQRERLDRVSGYLFGHSRDRIEESSNNRVERGSQETGEAFARRCLAASREIAA